MLLKILTITHKASTPITLKYTRKTKNTPKGRLKRIR